MVTHFIFNENVRVRVGREYNPYFSATLRIELVLKPLLAMFCCGANKRLVETPMQPP